MGIINKLITGGGMVAGAASRFLGVGGRTAVRGTQFGVTGAVETAAYGFLGGSRFFKRVKPSINNIFGVGIKHPYLMTGLFAGAALTFGVGKGSSRNLGEMSYAGPAPQFMYDYSKNIDKMMMASQGMPSVADNMGADGDLVLAMAQNKGRQL